MSRPQARLALLGVALLTVLAYWPVLHAGFVFEDPRTLNYLPTYVLHHWSAPVSRDLTYLTLIWNADHGLDPLAFHLTNLGIHLFNGLLLAGVARRAGLPRAETVIVVALFWLHPLQSETVAYVSGRFDLLGTTGLLVALWAVVGRRIAWGWLVAGLWVAVHAKESLIGLAIAWPALWWLSGRPRRTAVAMSAATVVLAVVLGWQAVHARGWPELEAWAAVPRGLYWDGQISAVLRLVTLTLVPWGPAQTHQVDLWLVADRRLWSLVGGAVTLLAALGWLTWAGPRRGWRLLAALAWWIFGVEGVRLLVPTEWIGEHHWYPVLPGILLAVALAVRERMWTQSTRETPLCHDRKFTMSAPTSS